ncbi:hypothetical protein EV589_0514 [Mycobacterium sp. BK558]|uniref:Secreted protein n=1 Tax=Mycolicibacterium chlorophenolicum TaxID=37916 RepID=A0A0J6VL96_9MYCO|nr:hypothetical protein [Mycolicibacterium chlorophenolicum]KMO70322.1 hypothetical protein MCHLDSM_05210 [Mycolicibacterium chlorophenolicum]RZT24793.1 hypothetical protein EV589_0514 [Mycobacterium sp. BK558]
MSRRRAAAALLAPSSVVAFALAGAAPADAECVSSNGTTVCSQGTVRGTNNGQGPGSLDTGPAWPYPCEYDWYCNDGGLSIIFTPGRN